MYADNLGLSSRAHMTYHTLSGSDNITAKRTLISGCKHKLNAMDRSIADMLLTKQSYG